MAAFFPPVPPEHSTRQPIKLSGFTIPAPSAGAASSTGAMSAPTFHPSSHAHSSIDPSILFGLGGTASPSSIPSSSAHGWSGAFAIASNSHLASSNPFQVGSSVLTDTDLDIENMLASFSQHQQQQQQQQQQQPASTSQAGDHHFFQQGHSAHPGPTAAGSNGFLGTSSMNYQRHGSISHQGQTSPHFFGINTSTAPDQAHPPSSVAAIPHFPDSPPLASSKTASSALSAVDFFPSLNLTNNGNHQRNGGSGSNSNKESPLPTASGVASMEPFSPATSKRSPPTSSNPARGREGRSLSRRETGSQERAGSRSRSTAVSTGVGKAPRTTSRSRSARRNSTAAGYQDRPSPSNNDRSNPSNAGTPSNQSNSSASTATTAATSATNGSSSHGTAAIIIPSSTPSSIPLPSPSIHYSASMPAYSSAANGAPSSLPSSLTGPGSWFSQGGVPFLPSMIPQPLKSVPEKTSAASESDPLTGWRPSQGVGIPASAPPSTTAARGSLTKPVNGGTASVSGGVGAGGKSDPKGGAAAATKAKKTQAQQPLEDVQEEEGDEKPLGGKSDPAEKRRKRRESHNLVERRRRDNINDRITELSELLPDSFINATTGPPIGPPRRSSSSSRSRGGGASEGGMGGENGASPPGVGSLSLMSPPPASGLALFGTSPTGGFGASVMHSAAASQAAANAASAAAAAAAKPNKGIVLAKSVEYIRYLLENIELQTQQIAELQRQNQELRNGGGGGNSAALPSHFDHATNSHPPYLQQQQQQHHHHSSSAQPQFHCPELPPSLGRAPHSGEWAAFEDEDVGHDGHYGAEAALDDDEDDEGMDES